jgi:hypothetical protein
VRRGNGHRTDCIFVEQDARLHTKPYVRIFDPFDFKLHAGISIWEKSRSIESEPNLRHPLASLLVEVAYNLIQ